MNQREERVARSEKVALSMGAGHAPEPADEVS
jgi:hypothetical protein